MQRHLGKGILLKIPYADGASANKPRTFIIIGYSSQSIEMLNVSSAKGKERKLSFPSNELLKRYNPPFCKPSFIKLDALYTIDYFDDLKHCILSNERTLEGTELSRITKLFNTYKDTNTVNTLHLTANDVLGYNVQYITQLLTASESD